MLPSDTVVAISKTPYSIADLEVLLWHCATAAHLDYVSSCMAIPGIKQLWLMHIFVWTCIPPSQSPCVHADWLWTNGCSCDGIWWYKQTREILHCVTWCQGFYSMGWSTYGLIFAMYVAVWLVHVPLTPNLHVFMQSGYEGSVMEIGVVTIPEPYCIV